MVATALVVVAVTEDSNRGDTIPMMAAALWVAKA